MRPREVKGLGEAAAPTGGLEPEGDMELDDVEAEAAGRHRGVLACVCSFRSGRLTGLPTDLSDFFGPGHLATAPH